MPLDLADQQYRASDFRDPHVAADTVSSAVLVRKLSA